MTRDRVYLQIILAPSRENLRLYFASLKLFQATSCLIGRDAMLTSGSKSVTVTRVVTSTVSTVSITSDFTAGMLANGPTCRKWTLHG